MKFGPHINAKHTLREIVNRVLMKTFGHTGDQVKNKTRKNAH
jgi:hypothetical protein